MQEALASAVPAIVMDQGGPRFIVRHGVTGVVASSDEEFCRSVAMLASSERVRREMGHAGRLQVEGQSWDGVFEEVHEGYAKPVGVL